MIEEKVFTGSAEQKPEKFRNRSFADYMDATIIVTVIVMFVAIIFTFLVEIVLSPEIDWKDVGVNTVIISACTIAIYLLVRSYAMRKGRRTQEWLRAHERLATLNKTMLADNRARLVPEYCREWEEQRLDGDIGQALARVGVTLEEFKQKYAKRSRREIEKLVEESGALTEYQLKTVLKAKRIRRLKFDERYFYASAAYTWRHRSPSGGLSSASLNRLKSVRIAVTTVMTSLVSASFFKDIIIDFTAESLIRCAVKLAIIVFFAAIGMVGGYTFSSVREVAEMNAKSDQLEIFFKWCENRDNK